MTDEERAELTYNDVTLSKKLKVTRERQRDWKRMRERERERGMDREK